MSKPIVNTAPHRDAPVTKRDFKALKGRLSLEFNYSSQIHERESVRAWNKFVPLTPDVAYRMLTRDLPRGTTVSFEALDTDGTGFLKIEKEEKSGANVRDLFSNSRKFKLGDGKVESGSVSVAGRRQGRGFGRITMRNQIEFFHACGVKKFEIFAASENGGYTWARLGFLPSDVAGDLKGGVARDVRKQLHDLRPVLDDKTIAKVENCLRFRRRTDLWRIADMDVDLVPLLAPAFNEKADKRFTEEQKEELCSTFGEDFRKAQRDNRPLPLGRVLLTGTSWDGVLDLNDRKQMKRVGAYCGGWKYIDMP
jgi:hypothetical protein